jgi:hypothetical protein
MAALAEHGLLEDLASASLHVPRKWVNANSLPAHLVKQVAITWIMHTTNAPSAGPARLMPLVVE